MSLLMDALKRAERARDASSGDAEPGENGLSETQGLSLDPMESAPPQEFDDIDVTGAPAPQCNCRST